jgi:GxxExxY protein
LIAFELCGGVAAYESRYQNLVRPGAPINEVKTAKTLAPEHEAQVLGYLKSARLDQGLLINFGSYKFEIRKFIWTNRK